MISSKEAKAFSDTMTQLHKNFESKGIPDEKGDLTFPGKTKNKRFRSDSPATDKFSR
jgi:hypothetical protein